MPDHSPSSLPWSSRPDEYASPPRSRARPLQRSRPSPSSIFQAPSREASSESWRRPTAPLSAYPGPHLDSRVVSDADKHTHHQYDPSDLLIRSASDHQYDPVSNHIQVKLPTHTQPLAPTDTFSFTQSNTIIRKDPSVAIGASLGTQHEHVHESPHDFSFSPFSPALHNTQLPDTRYSQKMGQTTSRLAHELGGFFHRKNKVGELPPIHDIHSPFEHNTPYDHGILAPEPSEAIPIQQFSTLTPDENLTPTPSVKPPTRVASAEWRGPTLPVYQPLQPSPRHTDPREAYAYRHGAVDTSEDRYTHSRVRAPPTPPFGTSKTEPFTLDPPPYTDEDISLPEPYNRSYPHPLSAYASLGVNEETRRRSGYDKALGELWNSNPDKLRGTILSEAGRDDLLPPALTMLIFPGEGNGIPERLWSRFESFGAARVPVGVAGIPAFSSSPLPPRLASLNHSNSMTSITSTISAYGNLSAHPSLTGPMSKSAMTPEDPSRHDDYFSLPRQVRHSSSMANLTGYGSMPPTPGQEPSTPSHRREWYPESRVKRVIPPLTPPPEPRHQVSDIPAIHAYSSPSPQGQRQSTRRASASPMDLHTVAEQYEPSSAQTSPRLLHTDVAPIGSERSTHRSQSLSQRNGRSPDLATMAEYFASRDRPRTSANLSLGGMGIVELGQRYAGQPFVPQSRPSGRPHGGREPWLYIQIPPRHGELTPRASSSSLSSVAEPQPHTHVDSRHSLSTSMSSSQNLTTPLLGSGWGLEVERGSPATSLSGSVNNSGSFGSAYGKRVASEVGDNPSESNKRETGQSPAKAVQGKDGQASTSWDFSTGKSIWC